MADICVKQDDPKAQLQNEMADVASRLHAVFDERVGTDSVDEQLAAVMAAGFAEAKILSFVPVLAERAAKRRLTELSGAIASA